MVIYFYRHQFKSFPFNFTRKTVRVQQLSLPRHTQLFLAIKREYRRSLFVKKPWCCVGGAMKTNIWFYQPSWQGKLATVEIQRVTFRKLALRRSANQICENKSSVGTSSKRKPSIRKKQPIYSVDARHAFHKLSSPAEEVQLMAFFIILRRFIGKYDLPNHSS